MHHIIEISRDGIDVFLKTSDGRRHKTQFGKGKIFEEKLHAIITLDNTDYEIEYDQVDLLKILSRRYHASRDSVRKEEG